MTRSPQELARDDNPRLIDRSNYWIAYAQWNLGQLPGPPCTECGDPMMDAPFIGALVCDECVPYVPQSERFL